MLSRAGLGEYRARDLRGDLVAGVTLAAYAVPVSLAYAGLAGLPPQRGLYAYVAGGLGYALLGSSRHLAVGPTSAISLLLGVSLVELAGADQARLPQLASLTSLFVAGVFFLAWLLRLSVLVNFISESVLTGFKAGAALVIATTQLPKLFGIPGGGEDFFERLWLLFNQLPATNIVAVAIGVFAIALLLFGEHRLPGRPVALIVVLLSLAVVAIMGLERYGLKVVGAVPAGLARFDVPWDVTLSSRSDVRQLVRLATACFLLSYIESVSAARTFALKHRYTVSPRQELLGLGLANLLGSFFQAYPVAGGLSQSAVNERAGARSPLSLLVASTALICVLLFLTGFFRTLPDAVLAAIVLVAVKGLVDLRELRQLWRVSRLDFAAAAVALAGVLLMGVLDGVIIAALASLLMVLWRGAHPHVAFLGRIPGTDRFSDLARHPENEPIPGVLVFRVQSSLLYFNVDHVITTVLRRALDDKEVHHVICDLSNVPWVDVAGARMLRRLGEELAERRIYLEVVEAHGPVRDLLRGEGIEQFVGAISRHRSLKDAIAVAGKGSVRSPSGISSSSDTSS